MITLESYKTYNNNTSATIPEWYKAERYEYCDSFFYDKKHSKRYSIISLLLSFIVG